jgi:hypothetical protein
MVALQTQAQKFLMQLFTKSCDLRRFLKAAVRGGTRTVRGGQKERSTSGKARSTPLRSSV